MLDKVTLPSAAPASPIIRLISWSVNSSPREAIVVARSKKILCLIIRNRCKYHSLCHRLWLNHYARFIAPIELPYPAPSPAYLGHISSVIPSRILLTFSADESVLVFVQNSKSLRQLLFLLPFPFLSHVNKFEKLPR